MNNTVYIVLNERILPDRFFNLESKVMTISSCYKNTCALVFFDCCREEITEIEMGINKRYKSVIKALARGDAPIKDSKAF